MDNDRKLSELIFLGVCSLLTVKAMRPEDGGQSRETNIQQGYIPMRIAKVQLTAVQVERLLSGDSLHVNIKAGTDSLELSVSNSVVAIHKTEQLLNKLNSVIGRSRS